MRYINWLLIQLFYWLYVLVAIFIYPLIYPYRSKIPKWIFPLWLIADDNHIGYPWYWTKFGIPLAKDKEDQIQPKGFKKFWIAYNWNVFRNGCWRLFHTILEQKQGEKTDIKVKIHEIYDGKDNSVFTVMRMKFKSNGLPSDNVGEELDPDLTFAGKNFVTYKIGKVPYFLYSYTKLSEDLTYGREFSIGWTGKRPFIRNKTFRKK